MRRHISKSIVRRSAALRNSLDKYNTLAPLQDPPRPTIDYADVTNCAWLGDFDILRHSRHDILSKPWSSRANREIANKWYKVSGARYELVRLNVEIRRLHEWTKHEDRQLTEVSSSLISSQPLLSAEIQVLAEKQHRINNRHRCRLQEIYCLKGFTGDVPNDLADGLEGLEQDNLDDHEILEPYNDDELDQEASNLEDTLGRFILD